MPHIKMYTRFATTNNNNNDNNSGEPEFAWIVLGSHNLSKAAWGALQKKRTQLFCRSYELSVLIMDDKPFKRWFGESQSSSESPPQPSVLIPYRFPPQPYSKGDKPWTVDGVHDEPEPRADRYASAYGNGGASTSDRGGHQQSQEEDQRRRMRMLQREDLTSMTIGDLKKALLAMGVDLTGCIERKDLVEKAKQLL